MRIDRFNFGEIVIDGRTYRQDVLLYEGRVKSDWWRLEGHLLQVADVAEALAAEPEVLVVGMGQPGRMQVDLGLSRYLKEKGIELLAVPTAQACNLINSLEGKRRWAAALHLTC